jgi:DNA repair exonuclease SbcCD ATPase subunit
MKEINFKKVFIKNFLSIGEDPVEINFTPGIHIITGINLDKTDSKNGVGKSTISDAIFFGIFGTTLRPLKKEDITNWINKKECSVTISFDVIDDGKVNEYVSLRSLNPSRVQLIKNGEDVSRTIGKTKEEMYDILGTTPEMFEQGIIMCLNEAEPFLSKTPAVKRKFIEDFFKIEIFGKMTKYIREEYNETLKLYDAENEKIIDLTQNINLYKQQQIEQKKRKDTRLNELESRRASAQEEIDILKSKIEDINAKITTDNNNDKNVLLKKLETIKDSEKKIQASEKENTKLITINQTTILSLKSKISELEKLSDGVCAYCKQPFSESNIQEKRKIINKCKEDISECEKIIIKATAESKVLLNSLDMIDNMKSDIVSKQRIFDLHENEIKKLESELKTQENWIKQIITDIDNLVKEKDTFSNIIDELTKRLNVLITVLEDIKTKITRLETDKFIISDEGVKNFIVKKMLKMLNGRLNFYLKQLDAPCTCHFNEYFDETIKNERGRECSYFNFSGGERKRIDLAMLFTFMDIRRIQSNISVNIGIFDELLDTALDSIGIEGALNILKDRSINNKEAIYIISHKGEAARHATGEIIYLEKENGITRRKINV